MPSKEIRFLLLVFWLSVPSQGLGTQALEEGSSTHGWSRYVLPLAVVTTLGISCWYVFPDTGASPAPLTTSSLAPPQKVYGTFLSALGEDSFTIKGSNTLNPSYYVCDYFSCPFQAVYSPAQALCGRLLSQLFTVDKGELKAIIRENIPLGASPPNTTLCYDFHLGITEVIENMTHVACRLAGGVWPCSLFPQGVGSTTFSNIFEVLKAEHGF